jgi:hypothetical protein
VNSFSFPIITNETVLLLGWLGDEEVSDGGLAWLGAS